MWIAGKRMKIKRDGGYVFVNPGDPVPEAEDWPNQRPWINGGFIKKSEPGPQAETVEAKMSQKAPALTPKPRPVATPAPVAAPKAKPVAKPAAKPEKPTPKPARKGKKLKGKGECPYCKEDFIQLERHKCKKAPL